MNREELLKISKPILFNTEMVQAILWGRKTVTRRVLKLPNHVKQSENGLYTLFAEGACYENQSMEQIKEYIKPPFKKGDYLYVRETWSDHYVPDDDGKANLEYCYKADGINLMAECLPGETNRWYPSIHMPKEAARLFLKVTDVRVERLQDIIVEPDFQKTVSNICAEGLKLKGVLENYSVLVDDFKDLWNSTIKKADLDKYGWEANPWVWVIEFERVEV